MELRVLKYFLVVAREQNITRAAEQLHITQPTLSRQLAALEDELETKLFVRSRYKMNLTEDGLLLYGRAEKLIELAEKTEQDMKRGRDSLSGVIKVGCGEVGGAYFMSRAMAEFREINPRVYFDMYSGNEEDMKDCVTNGRIDICLLVEPADMTSFDYVHLETKEQWKLLLPKRHPLTRKGSITPADLVGIPLIMPEPRRVNSEIAGWLGEYRGLIEIAATYELGYNAPIMAMGGLGAAICFERPELSFPDMRYMPLEPPLESGRAMVWKKHHDLSNAAKEFIAYIQKCL